MEEAARPRRGGGGEKKEKSHGDFASKMLNKKGEKCIKSALLSSL